MFTPLVCRQDGLCREQEREEAGTTGYKIAGMNVWGFLIAAVLLTLMPGPDILFVVTQSITRGKKAGIVFASGLCTGLVFHVVAVSLGLSVLLMRSPFLFTALKCAGAAYLIYLGVQAFRHRHRTALRFCREEGLHSRLYRKGILMNLLNPKVILFFLAFFPQFVDPDAGEPVYRMLFLGSLFILQAILVFSGVAVLADRLSEHLMENPRFSRGMNIAEALIYGLIGVSILFS